MFTKVCFVAALALLLVASSHAQSPPRNNTNQTVEDPELLRWKISLTALAQEAKTVFPEERRPYAMVDVGNALWEVDRAASRSLYISALDSALANSRQDKKYKDQISLVLSAAAKLDSALARDLNKRLLDEEKDDDATGETALDLVDENPEAAAQIAEAIAPGALKNGTAALLILRLAKKDLRLSDHVYGVYLTKATADPKVDLGSILTLAGYAFGRSEEYSVTTNGELSGITMLPITGLTARPYFANAFLDLASRKLALTIERRDQAVGGDGLALNYTILFASEYVTPDAARFSPSTLSVWQMLHDRAIVGVTPQQTQKIQSFITQIQQTRLRTDNFANNPQSGELETEAGLENVEKLPGTCRRDVIYSNAAMIFASRKDFKRSLELAGKIQDLKQSDTVKDAIAISVAEASLEEGSFDEAAKVIAKIAWPEQKARLSIELVRALSKSDAREVSVAVNDALKLIDKVAGPFDRASLLFALATIVVKGDAAEGQSILRNAIKHLNKAEPSDVKIFEVPIKVPLSCPGDTVSWYGGSDTLLNSNVLDAIVVFAELNSDEATRTAEEIGDKVTKIRASAAISRRVLKDLRRDGKR